MPSPFPKKAITSTPFIYQLMTTVRVWQVGHFGAPSYHHAQAEAFVLGTNLIIL
jgi:hypothetical protein